ncbi:hypothetical protein Rcae01_03213 [Novipirellula caenicola]|uniref:Uncharacterized protein n=1 Tax=Novipirellula caenicola TaxID=1536901 RepID=A0ABP9VSX1_9BACT
MDFLVRQWWIRRTRKSIVRLNQQAVKNFDFPRGDAMLPKVLTTSATVFRQSLGISRIR